MTSANQLLLRSLEEIYQEVSVSRILDLGVGSGLSALMLAKSETFGDTPIIAYDISSSMINEARIFLRDSQVGDQVTLQVADALDVQVDGSIPLITGFNMIHYLDDDKKKKLVQKYSEVQEKGGRIALSTGFFQGSKSEDIFYRKFSTHLMRTLRGYGYSPRDAISNIGRGDLSIKDYETLLTQAGYDVSVEVGDVHFDLTDISSFFLSDHVIKNILPTLNTDIATQIMTKAMEKTLNSVDGMSQKWLSMVGTKI